MAIRNTNRRLLDLRVFLVFAFYLLASLFLLGKLFKVSVLDNEVYAKEATEQHLAKRIVTASRGEIYLYDSPDRSTTFAVAKNMDTFSVSLVPKNIKNIDKIAESLSGDLGIPKSEILEKYNSAKDKFYLPPLKRGLTFDEAKKIENLNLIGVILTKEPKRIYPEKKLASQVIGFVDGEGNGQYGIEGTYNDWLKGRSGEELGRKDVLGTFVKVSESVTASDGASFVLTLDRNVQFIVEEKLKNALEKYSADSGSIIVIEPKTGSIIAMANEPSYDLNEFNKVAKENQSVFLNRCYSGVWEPGSVVKPIVISAALDSGTIDENFEGTYKNFVVVGGHEIHTATDKAFGKETVTQILENSDNVAMVDISEKLGKEKMYEYFEKFNFTDKLGIDVVSEISGKIPPPKGLRDINRATMSFGQGMSLTPLQMISAYATIANSGVLMKPRVVSEIRYADGRVDVREPEKIREVLKPDTAKAVTKMLISVVERGHGKQAKVPGYSVAGKTGTAEIPKAGGGYEEGKHIGSFAGFVPANEPKFAILVKLDNPKNVEFAESSAAPTFSEVASFLLSYYRVPPDKN